MIIFPNLGTHFGRLGNQLFQIAACTAHAKRCGTTAAFNHWPYNKYLKNQINDSLAEGSAWIGTVEHKMVLHTQFGYKPIPAGQNMLLLGFFQSEKYFEDAGADIATMFTPGNELMKTVRAAGGHVILMNNVVAVHVRRGDYLTKPGHHPVQPVAYYAHAMAHIKRKHPDAKFLFFSDDIPWCKQHFTADDCYFSEGSTDVVDMYLMAQCQHHIIANSSFSWWGAWLRRLFAGIDDQIVIAPKVWVGKDWQDSAPDDVWTDIYCKGWIVM